MNAILVIKYKCPHCGKEHEKEIEALKCCTDVKSFERFQCTQCDTIFEDEEEAENCCDEEEEE